MVSTNGSVGAWNVAAAGAMAVTAIAADRGPARRPGGAVAGASLSSGSRSRHRSRRPPSAYRIRRSARRPDGPNRFLATVTSIRCPTTSRPSRIHVRRATSRRRPATSASAPVIPLGRPGGSMATSRTPARRAIAARRRSRSATLGPRGPAGVPRRLAVRGSGDRGSTTRSTTRRSTARPWTSEPAMASPSSSESGVRTTSHSRRTPRATASTGSRLRERSSQATMEPAAWASATSRRARVVLPLE